MALRLGAYGVHLGQEDLDSVDLDALRPSYIACGPIFATQSKDIPWIPQELEKLR